MAGSSTSLAAETEQAVAAWLKASLQVTSLNQAEKDGLNFAIDMVSLSAGFVIQCAQDKRQPIGKDLAIYIFKKSTMMAKIVDHRPIQCIASALDLGVAFAMDGPKLVAATAAGASGVTLLLAMKAGLSLLLQVQEVWVHCSPLVKAWVETTRRTVDLETIHITAMAKLGIYVINYVPGGPATRTA